MQWTQKQTWKNQIKQIHVQKETLREDDDGEQCRRMGATNKRDDMHIAVEAARETTTKSNQKNNVNDSNGCI